MTKILKSIFLTIAIAGVSGCATDGVVPSSSGVTSTIDLGDPDAEEKHNVEVKAAEQVSDTYPDRWIMAARASGYEEGHEPYRVVDGNAKTRWQVTGRPKDYDPDGFLQGDNWLEIDLNTSTDIKEISINWLGNHTYNFEIYTLPWSDLRRKVFESQSKGGAQGLESYKLPKTITTRTVRIMFNVKGEHEEKVRQGIKEVRIGKLSWPDSYPPAAYKISPVKRIERPYYYCESFHHFNPLLQWPQFNIKRSLADGHTGRRIMNTGDFEGGHIDLDIAIEPDKQNWITLKMWESHPNFMTERGNTIALEAFIDHPERNRRWFMPEFVTHKPNLTYEWYGKKPRPGRWVYAHYKLHEDVVRDKKRIRLRLQGVGNDERDKPMRAPAPPVYSIISHTRPSFDLQNSNK